MGGGGAGGFLVSNLRCGHVACVGHVSLSCHYKAQCIGCCMSNIRKDSVLCSCLLILFLTLTKYIQFNL